MNINKVWSKNPSVMRPGRYFYSNVKAGISVTQDWDDGIWKARKNGGPIIASAKNAALCMAMVDSIVKGTA